MMSSNVRADRVEEVDREHDSHVNSARNKGKIRVFVKSTRTLVSAGSTAYPSYIPVAYTPLTIHASGGKRILVYQNELDAEQEKIVHEAADLAQRMHMDFEVKDLGKQNILSRIFTRLARGNVTVPSVVFPGTSVAEIEEQIASTYGAVSTNKPVETNELSEVCLDSSSFAECSCGVNA